MSPRRDARRSSRVRPRVYVRAAGGGVFAYCILQARIPPDYSWLRLQAVTRYFYFHDRRLGLVARYPFFPPDFRLIVARLAVC